MSKINPGLYSSDCQSWMTPPSLVEALLRFEGRTAFDLDPCCSVPNIPAHVHYFDGERDGLAEPWLVGLDETLVFVNPPYGTEIKPFLRKIKEEYGQGCSIWALLPARTETIYQHDDGLAVAGLTVFLKGKPKFWKNGKPYMVLDKKTGKWKEGTAPFPAMLLYYGDDWLEKAQRWACNPPLEGTLMVPYC